MIELPKRSRPDIHADINIVPYIDVMLVLLVIFMMTTPIIEQGVEVDLPSAPASVVDYQDQQPSIISVDVDGNYFINPMTSPGVEEIEDLMIDENFFKSKDHIELTEEHKTSSLELESAFSDWSKISDEIEDVSKRFEEKINQI